MMDNFHRDDVDDRRPPRRPLRAAVALVATTASLLAAAGGGVALLNRRRGNDNNNASDGGAAVEDSGRRPAVRRRGRELQDPVMTNWMDAQAPAPLDTALRSATVTPILATMHADPLFTTDAATTAADTTAAATTVAAAVTTEEPPPLAITDPVDQLADPPFTTAAATTVAAATTAAATTSAAAVTTVEPAPPVPHTKVALWYPAQDPTTGHKSCVHNADYPDSYITSTTAAAVLFDTEYECCNVYDICGTEPATPEIPKPKMWHPVEHEEALTGGVTDDCVYSDEYPIEYLEPATAAVVLFHSETDCCAAYGCNIPVQDHWYPKLVDGTPSCVYDDLYDPTYAQGDFASSFLFDTETKCCEAFPVACMGMLWHPNADGTSCVFGNELEENAGHLYMTEGECLAYVEGGAATTAATASAVTTAQIASDADTTVATTEATTAATVDPCTECIWHESHTQPNTCTNSLEYPFAFEQGRPFFFHHTAQDCCDKKFPEGCTIVDDGTPDGDGSASAFTELTGDLLTDDFEGTELTIPFDLGSPPKWERSPSKSRSGAWSLVNVPVEGFFATADLVLRLEVPPRQSYLVSCMANIRTSMPYEHFALFVNGEQRNTYHQMIGGEDDWVEVATGIGPGTNTLIFRVENSDIEPSTMGPVRQSDFFGTGSVHLDECEIRLNFGW